MGSLVSLSLGVGRKESLRKLDQEREKCGSLVGRKRTKKEGEQAGPGTR